VLEHDTNFEGDYVELRYDGNAVTIDEIKDELEGIGYRPQSVRDAESKN
jgi:hypothetical protein